MSLENILLSLIQRLQELDRHGAEKKQNALRQCGNACMVTRALMVSYVVQETETGTVIRDYEKEAEIARKWADTSASFIHIDEFFSEQCSEIALYFSDPAANPIRDASILGPLFANLKSSCHPSVGKKSQIEEDRVLIYASDIFCFP